MCCQLDLRFFKKTCTCLSGSTFFFEKLVFVCRGFSCVCVGVGVGVGVNVFLLKNLCVWGSGRGRVDVFIGKTCVRADVFFVEKLVRVCWCQRFYC